MEGTEVFAGGTDSRSARRASSMMRSNIRTTASDVSGPARSCADCFDLLEHLLLAVRLIDRHPEFVFQLPDLRPRTRRGRSSSRTSWLFDDVDAITQLVDAQDFSQRTYSSTRVLSRETRLRGQSHRPAAANDRRIRPLRGPRAPARASRCEPQRDRQVAHLRIRSTIPARLI